MGYGVKKDEKAETSRSLEAFRPRGQQRLRDISPVGGLDALAIHSFDEFYQHFELLLSN